MLGIQSAFNKRSSLHLLVVHWQVAVLVAVAQPSSVSRPSILAMPVQR